MPEKKLITERKGHVLLMGLNRPDKMNAFDVELFTDLAAAMGELNDDPELRCGLLHAAGKHFTAGLDLPDWAGVFSKGVYPPPLPAGACDIFSMFDGIRHLEKPLVMAAQGICFTIGLEIMLAADIRIVSQDIRLAVLEVKRGIYPVGGATIRLPREIGWGNAMRYILTGDEMHAEEALRLGLVQEVTENGKQFERALAIAEHIAKQAPLAVKASLLSCRRVYKEGEKQAVARLMPDLMVLMRSEDAAEGVKSFLERREAKFQGR
ncbi:MAG: Carnitinyl-CoA dehydratase [Smithella sp. PtaU1.Bin162]|nr:MAG: Carnitinyl-CoA dehydratase [Smithella sp. PtaU1.Bin162]